MHRRFTAPIFTALIFTALFFCAALLFTACSSSDETSNQIVVGQTEPAPTATPGPTATPPSAPVVIPLDTDVACTPISSADIVGQQAEMSDQQLREMLPLMKSLQTDTITIWEDFGIQPAHLIVDGLPAILIWSADLSDNCADILAAVGQPALVRIVNWREADFGAESPWRRLIWADLDAASDADGNPVWHSVGDGMFDITSVDVRDDQQALGQQLVDTYGPLISVTRSGFDLNAADEPKDRSRCQVLPEPSAPATLVAEDINWDGEQWGGTVTVTIRNNGTETLHLVPDRLAEVTLPQAVERESQFAGAMTSEARGSKSVESGASIDVTGIVSLSSCTNVPLAAGDYDLTMVIAVHDQQSFEGSPTDRYLVVRLPINLR